MLIRDSEWQEIRLRFSEQEKAELREAVTGETICPRGFNIDPDELDADMHRKLKNALEEVR
jgi:hypothetical protein